MVALTVFTVSIEGWSRHTAWRNQLAQSRVAAENLALAAEEHVEGAMHTVSWLLDGLVERVETDGMDGTDRSRLRHYMTSRLSRKDSALEGLFVYDARGELLVSTEAHPIMPVRNRDRAYFNYHRTHGDTEVRVGPPIRSRFSGGWVITMSRRWNDDAGRFAGIVLATIPISYFEQYYRRFSVGSQGAMLLALADGTVLVGSRSIPDDIGQSAAATPLLQPIQRGPAYGTVMLTPDFDGIERLASYRRLNDYPLVVAVSLAKDELMAGWWTVTLQESGAIAVMLGTLYVLGGWLISHIHTKQRLEDRLRQAQADLRAKNAVLDRMARCDALTGLENRRSLDERLAMEAARAERDSAWLALIMIDVDFFKRYNDLHGHAAGDDCLRSVAAALGAIAQRPADLAARYGGEEFAILLPNTDCDGALRVAEAARTAVGALALPHPGNPTGIVTISAGVAALRTVDGGDVRSLVEAADAALYQAKEGGRNRVAAHAAMNASSR